MIATIPGVVRERLISARLIREGDLLAEWLARPRRVRADCAVLAALHSSTGRTLTPQDLLWQAGEMLRQFILRYLDANRADLPEELERIRGHFYDRLERQVRDWPPGQVTAALRDAGLDSVREPGLVPAAVLRDFYVAARAQAHAEVPLRADDPQAFADQAKSREEQLAYLSSRDLRMPLGVLGADQQRRYLLTHYTTRSGPLDDLEVAVARHAVQTWEQSWAADSAEAFPPLLAHALGVQIQVVRYSQEADDNISGRQPVVTVGDPGNPVIDMYHNGATHYNGSVPPPPAGPAARAEQILAARPAPHPAATPAARPRHTHPRTPGPPRQARITVTKGPNQSVRLRIGRRLSRRQGRRRQARNPVPVRAGVLLVDAHGTGGGLPASGSQLTDAVTDAKSRRPLTEAFLMACQQQGGQEFATSYRLRTWASPDHDVWVSLRTGKVFVGRASLITDSTGKKRLRPIAEGAVLCYDPDGTGPVANPGPPPLLLLTAEQVTAPGGAGAGLGAEA